MVPAARRYALLCALAGVVRAMPKPLSAELFERVQSSAIFWAFGDDDENSLAAASLVGACGRWADASQLIEAVSEGAADAEAQHEEWRKPVLLLRCHLALLRAAPPSALRGVLSDLFATAEEATTHDKVDVRQ